jgi:flavin reductase (DIM6/NTAB) family NADH-FMN oxidoreductase RutF
MSGEGDTAPRSVAEQAFRDTMASVCAPVTVVSAMDKDRPHATTVSAFSSVSLDPPMILVALDRGSDLLPIVTRARRFGVSLLAHGQHEPATALARKGSDKLTAVAWTEHRGLPRIPGGGWVECEVGDLVDGGDHVIVLGRVVASEPVGGAPLVYHGRRFGTHSHYAAPHR